MAGLTIRPIRQPDDAHASETITFDPLAHVDPDRILYWQDRLQLKLSPLGALGLNMCLLIAEDGAVFATWDRSLYKVGYSFEDAMENTLVFGRRRPIELGEMAD